MSKKLEKKEVIMTEVVSKESVVVIPSIKLVNMDLTEAVVAYQTEGSAGIDLSITDSVTVYRGKDPIMVRTGVRLLNSGVEDVVALLTLRSSLRKQGFSIMGVGVIDADYEGEIVIPLMYIGGKTGVKLLAGDRVAQLVLLPFARFDNEVKSKERRDGGFGSTKPQREDHHKNH